MSRATNTLLDGLHGLTAEAMADELRRNLERARAPKQIRDPNDQNKMIANPEYEPLSPKLLAVIRAFLKDNGIDAPEAAPRFSSLIAELQTINVDELPAV